MNRQWVKSKLRLLESRVAAAACSLVVDLKRSTQTATLRVEEKSEYEVYRNTFFV
jgi:hypothetical protein